MEINIIQLQFCFAPSNFRMKVELKCTWVLWNCKIWIMVLGIPINGWKADMWLHVVLAIALTRMISNIVRRNDAISYMPFYITINISRCYHHNSDMHTLWQFGTLVKDVLSLQTSRAMYLSLQKCDMQVNMFVSTIVRSSHCHVYLRL